MAVEDAGVRDEAVQLDVVIFGGGAAGLWLLDELIRAGYRAVLLEAEALGAGQTVASQGIIHGGLKYTLSGLFNRSADAIKHLPGLWRRCLAGEAKPDLRAAPLRSDFCYLWSTGSLRSKAGLFGAAAALQVRPIALTRDHWPTVLAHVGGSVSRLDEQVIAPAGFISALADQHAGRILKVDANGIDFQISAAGVVRAICLAKPASPAEARAGAATGAVGETGGPAGAAGATAASLVRPAVAALTGGSITLRPRTVVLTAGRGNAALRAQLGLDVAAMQRRPLHVVMARGSLPVLNGHCTDGNRTSVTITTDRDHRGRTVWQIGGQVSEDGVPMSRGELIAHVRRELARALPGVSLEEVAFSTYRVDRAEGATRGGKRPAEVVVRSEGNVITGWPTKLVLAPELALRIMKELPAPAGDGERAPDDSASHDRALATWPRPATAEPPWEQETQWL